MKDLNIMIKLNSKPIYRFSRISRIINLSIMSILLCLSFTAKAEVPVQEFKTNHQIPVLFVEDKSSQLTTVLFAFKGTGSAYDPSGKEGLSSIMTDLLFEQSKEGFDRHSLNKKLKDMGVLGGIHATVDADNIHFRFKAPTTKLKEVFAILKQVISEPAFNSEELDKMKNFDPSGSRLASSSEREFASKVLMQKMYNGQFYAKPSYGTLDGRQSVTLTDVKTAFQERFIQGRLIFSVIGNVSPKILSQYIDDTFAHLPKDSPLAPLDNIQVSSTGDITLIPKNSPQSGVVFGQPSVSRQDKDYLAMLIVNDILGGRPFTSRLWMEAREKRGLVYQIDTNFNHWEKSSLLAGQFEADNQKTPEMIKLIKDTWQLLKEKGVTEEEFAASKKGLLGEYALLFTSSEGIAQYLLATHLSGLPIDYINKGKLLFEAVTLEQVNQATKQHLNPDLLTFVVVGQPVAETKVNPN
jgi:zinc protease